MTGPNDLLAIIRAHRPTFRSPADRLAFAVYAFLLADGWKLVGMSKEVDNPPPDYTFQDEISPDGWNDADDEYTFRFEDLEGVRPPLLVRALAMGDKLLVNWASLGTDVEPGSTELDVKDYTTDSNDAVGGYKNLDKLIGRLEELFHGPSRPSQTALTGANAGAPATTVAPTKDAAAAVLDSNDPDDPLRIMPGPYPVQAVPPSGDPDMMPSIVPPPGMGGVPDDRFGVPGIGPAPPGGFGGLPGPMGGGMLVGPDDPLFAGRLHRPPHAGGRGLPPGARWDPIRPPGMEGFNPGDFQRSNNRPQFDPDIAQPGPGRGTDWDMMYG